MDLQGERVVVTGGTGFLGRHVAVELRRAGAEVVTLGRRDYDLRRRDAIDAMLAEHRPAAVVHLAAVVGGIGANLNHPGRFFYENALMGVELIEGCRAAGISKTLVAGTVCAYPRDASVPFREDELWAGYPEETNAAYGLAKKMLLVQAQAYRQQYNMNVIYLLPVNLYGPGDNFDLETSHVIPAMIRKFTDARDRQAPSVVLWGDGSATREFLYVADAARAFRMALEQYDGAEPVNVGSGDEISISKLATQIAGATGYCGEVVWDSTKPNGQPRRRLSTQRAKDYFGFTAQVSLDEGIATTLAWLADESERSLAAS